MDETLAGFIRKKQINSFPKLRFLLFLRQYPCLHGCTQQLAERMYIEAPLLEQMITEFQTVELLESRPYEYSLRDEPGLKVYLDELAAAFEHPLIRQELLELVRGNSLPSELPVEIRVL